VLTEAQRVRRFVAAAAARVCLATERAGHEVHPRWRDLLRTARRHTVHPLLLRDLDAAYAVARDHFHSMSGGHWSCWYLVKTALLRDACMTPDDGRSFVFALEKIMEVTRHRWQGARELRRWVREQVPRLGLAWPLADDERLRDDPKEKNMESMADMSAEDMLVRHLEEVALRVVTTARCPICGGKPVTLSYRPTLYCACARRHEWEIRERWDPPMEGA
jgi:hypothetical protein